MAAGSSLVVRSSASFPDFAAAAADAFAGALVELAAVFERRRLKTAEERTGRANRRARSSLRAGRAPERAARLGDRAAGLRATRSASAVRRAPARAGERPLGGEVALAGWRDRRPVGRARGSRSRASATADAPSVGARGRRRHRGARRARPSARRQSGRPRPRPIDRPGRSGFRRSPGLLRLRRGRRSGTVAGLAVISANPEREGPRSRSDLAPPPPARGPA